MGHPVCGKCGSTAVFQETDIEGKKIIGCFMCGSRYPGAGYFHMSDESQGAHIKDSQGKEKLITDVIDETLEETYGVGHPQFEFLKKSLENVYRKLIRKQS